MQNQLRKRLLQIGRLDLVVQLRSVSVIDEEGDVDQSIVVAIVSASGAVIVGVAGLVINVVWMGRTFEQLEKRLSERLTRVENTLEIVQADLRVFYQDLARIKAKVGLD